MAVKDISREYREMKIKVDDCEKHHLAHPIGDELHKIKERIDDIEEQIAILNYWLNKVNAIKTILSN